MKYSQCFGIILSFLVLGTTAFSESVSKSPMRHPLPPYSRLQIISFQDFETLTFEDRVKYIQILRDFIVDQDHKWSARNYSEIRWNGFDRVLADLNLVSRSEADESAKPAKTSDGSGESETCDYSNLDAGTQKYMNSHPHCTVGGLMVCFTPEQDSNKPFHLWCRPDDWSKKKSSQPPYNCKAPEDNACAFPAFMNKDTGGALCVSGPKGISQICKDSPKGLSAENVVKKIEAAKPEDKKKYEDAYNKLGSDFSKYCGQVGKLSQHFDYNDCKEINTRLGSLRGATPEVETKLAAPEGEKPEVVQAASVAQKADCNVSFENKSSKEKYTLKLHKTEGGFILEGAKGTEGWTKTTCDSGLEAATDNKGHFVEASDPQDAPYKMCLAKRDASGFWTDVIAVADDTTQSNGKRCSTYFSRSLDGKFVDGKCLVTWSDGVTYSYDLATEKIFPAGNWKNVAPKDAGYVRIEPKTDEGRIPTAPDIVTNKSGYCKGVSAWPVAYEEKTKTVKKTESPKPPAERVQ